MANVNQSISIDFLMTAKSNPAGFNDIIRKIENIRGEMADFSGSIGSGMSKLMSSFSMFQKGLEPRAFLSSTEKIKQEIRSLSAELSNLSKKAKGMDIDLSAISKMQGILRSARAKVQYEEAQFYKDLRSPFDLSQAKFSAIQIPQSPLSYKAPTGRQVERLKESLTPQPSGLDKFMSSQVLAVGRLARYYASFELINGSINAINTAMQETIMLQDKMLEVKKFLPVNSATKELENNVYALAKAYGVSAETVLNSYSEFAQQGMKANQILDATKAALLGVNVASIDFAESTKFLTTATNVWGYSLSQSTTLFDKLSKVQAMSAVTAQAMISAIQKTGSIAHDVGVSMDELLGYIAAITEKTQQSGEVTGNALKTMFERLLRSDSIRKLEAMDPLKGITFRNIQTGELEKAGVILSQIAGKWKDLTDIERKNIGEVIAGGRQINTFTALMSNFDSAVKLTGESLNSMGFAQQQNQTEMQKFTKNAQILKNVFLELTTDALTPFMVATNLSINILGQFGSSVMPIAKAGVSGFGAAVMVVATMAIPTLIRSIIASGGVLGTFLQTMGNAALVTKGLGAVLSGPAGIAFAIGSAISGFLLYNSSVQESKEKTEDLNKELAKTADSLNKLSKGFSAKEFTESILGGMTSEQLAKIIELNPAIESIISYGEKGPYIKSGRQDLARKMFVEATKQTIQQKAEGGVTFESYVKDVGLTKDQLSATRVQEEFNKLLKESGDLQKEITGYLSRSTFLSDSELKTLDLKKQKQKEINGLLAQFEYLAKASAGSSELSLQNAIEAAQQIAKLFFQDKPTQISPISDSQEKLEAQRAVIEEIGIEMEKGLFTAQQKNKEFDIENELLENLKSQQFELGAKEIELREQVNKGIDGAKDKYDEVIKKNEIVKSLIGDQKDILQRLLDLLNQDYFINVRFNMPQGIPLPGFIPIGGEGAVSSANLNKTAQEAKARETIANKEILKTTNDILSAQNSINALENKHIKIKENDAKSTATNNIKIGNEKAKLVKLEQDFSNLSKIASKDQVEKSKIAIEQNKIENQMKLKTAKEVGKIDRAGQKTVEDKAHIEALRKVHEIEAQISLTKQFQSYWESKLEDSYLLRYDRETEALQIQIDNNKNILDSVKGLNEEDRNRYNEKIKELNTELDARKKNREEAIKINEEEKRAKDFKRSLGKADEQFSFRQELNAIGFSGRYGITPEEQAAFNIQQQYESVLFEKEKAKMIYQEKYRITLDSIIAKQKTQKDFSMEMAKQQAIQLTLQSEEVQNADEAVIKQQQKLEILYRQTEQQERQRAFAGVDEIKGVISGLFDTFNPITIYEQQKAKAKQMSEAYAEMAQAQSAANTAARDVASAEATGNIDKINSAREKYNQTLNQIEEVKKKMQDINSETNKWADALKSIGNILFKKIADQVTDIFIKKTGIADMFANLFLGIGGLGGKQQTQSAMFGGGAAGITTAMAGAMAFPSMAGMGGGAGFISGGNQAIINVMAQKQQGLGGMMSPMMGTSTGLGKWLNKPLDKWGSTGMGYLSSGLMGYGLGQAIGSKGGGALAGGLMGFLTAGPIGGLLGAIGGFFGGGKDEEPAPPPVKEREFYSTQKNVDALDRNTAALMKLSEGVFNAPSTFEMPRLDAKSNISQVINVYVGPGSNSKNISSGVSEAVYKANMATFGTKTSNVVG